MAIDSVFPCNGNQLPVYTAYRINTPLAIDGNLSKPTWQSAAKSSRFVDLVYGTPTLYDTRVAVLWDLEHLYVAYWIEEPQVQAKFTERDSLIYEDNDVELFIAGEDGYYEFEINAFGTVYEVFFLWEDTFERKGYDNIAEFNRQQDGVRMFDGVGFSHPRGRRIGYWNWDYPGLKNAVVVDGNINDHTTKDNGWTVELALPWHGLFHLAGERSLPPDNGDCWRMDFSRFNQYKASPPSKDSSGWAWSSHGVWDSHIPECFTRINFSTDLLEESSEM